jgi:hypothetical protein
MQKSQFQLNPPAVCQSVGDRFLWKGQVGFLWKGQVVLKTDLIASDDLGEILNINIMSNDIEYSISIDLYIYISIFQVF